MILDLFMQFCKALAFSGGDAYSDTVDLGAGGDALVNELTIVAQMPEAAVGGTNAIIKIETAVDTAFTSPIVLYTSDTFLTAAMTQGKKLFAIRFPRGVKRYVRAKLDVTGTFTKGTVDIFTVTGDSVGFDG